MHLTKTIAGTMLIGPTARYIKDKNDYERDREPVEDFAAGAKPLLPEIEASDLVLAYSGIRAKLVPPSDAQGAHPAGMADFIIQRDPEFPRVVQLMGIESPGLTSAPSIAEQVRDLVAEVLE
jgi:glycerol-3-phosphate dehydrogenase